MCTHYLLNVVVMKVNVLPFKMLHFMQKLHSGGSDSAFELHLPEIIMNLGKNTRTLTRRSLLS